MRASIHRSVAVLAALAISVAACGSDDESSASTSPPTTEAPAAADDAADSGSAGSEFAPGVLESGATITTYEQGDLLVHTYANPEAGFGNTTAIFESDNQLVLVDSHFGDPWASEFRAFADSLGKPIERLFITHDHPDHIGGVELAFGDVVSMSSVGVVEASERAGITISDTLEAGDVTIDGVTYRLDVYTDAEAEEQVVISIPDAGVVAIGDLVYSDYHAVMAPTFDNWISLLETIGAADGTTLVIPGHGTPGGPEVIDGMIDYLTTAGDAYDAADDAETFNAALVEAYPDRAGSNLLEFGAGNLFPKSE